MNRSLICVMCASFTLLLAGCGPGLFAPGPPLPGFGPDFGWIVVVIVVVVGGIWFSRSHWSDSFRLQPPQRSQASEILRERYAKGEISREEYIRMADDLDQQRNVRAL